MNIIHPENNYFSTSLDQYKYCDDVFGNQFVLLKDFSQSNTIYDKKSLNGEVWVKTVAGNIYSLIEIFANIFDKHLSQSYYASLSANIVTNIDIFADTIVLQLQDTDATKNHTIIEKYSYDYDNDSFISLNGTINYIGDSNYTSYWFNNTKNKIVFCNLFMADVALIPNIYTIDISDNNIELYQNYPSVSELSSLSAEMDAANFDINNWSGTVHQPVFHSDDNYSYHIDVMGNRSDAIDFLSYKFTPLQDDNIITTSYIKGQLQPYNINPLSAITFYSSLSALSSLSANVGDEILIDMSLYPHDGYGASKIIYDFGDGSEKVIETQNNYIYDTSTWEIAKYYSINNDPLQRPIYHTYNTANNPSVSSDTYTLKVIVENAGTLRRQVLSKYIKIYPQNIYNTFEDVYLIGARQTSNGKQYCLETKNPHYVSFLNIITSYGIKE